MATKPKPAASNDLDLAQAERDAALEAQAELHERIDRLTEEMTLERQWNENLHRQLISAQRQLKTFGVNFEIKQRPKG